MAPERATYVEKTLVSISLKVPATDLAFATNEESLLPRVDATPWCFTSRTYAKIGSASRPWRDSQLARVARRLQRFRRSCRLLQLLRRVKQPLQIRLSVMSLKKSSKDKACIA
jgi:hypothetical protein